MEESAWPSYSCCPSVLAGKLCAFGVRDSASEWHDDDRRCGASVYDITSERCSYLSRTSSVSAASFLEKANPEARQMDLNGFVWLGKEGFRLEWEGPQDPAVLGVRSGRK